MSITLIQENNSADRIFDVFFYGLNMDAKILSSKGVVPRQPRVAYIDNFTVRLGAKAMLLRSCGRRAYGMLFKLTHHELDDLYATLIEYRAEPFQAVLANGERVAAISMVHVDPPINSAQDADYSAAFHDLTYRLGLPHAAAREDN